MRVRQKAIFFLLLSVPGALLPATLAAQNREPTTATYSPNADRLAKPPAPRVLTADEGLAVLSAALESRAHPQVETDCSHLVHTIYERAGFPYSYASSTTLYAGSTEFRRVVHPRAGDLVVWPGHVGILVNPTQHSFFSALRSGLGVDSYDSAYWRARGRPRFLRYVTDAPATNEVSPAKREATLKTAASSDPPPPSRNTSLDTRENPRLQAEPTRNIPALAHVATVHSQRPTTVQLADALQQILSENREALRSQDLLNPSNPLVVFDQLFVEKVHVRHDQGWVEVRIVGALKLSRQKTNLSKPNDRQRWPLVRRAPDTWEITLPSQSVYIRSSVAVRTLAHQLAALTDEDADRPDTAAEKLQLSRLLNACLEKQAGSR